MAEDELPGVDTYLEPLEEAREKALAQTEDEVLSAHERGNTAQPGRQGAGLDVEVLHLWYGK